LKTMKIRHSVVINVSAEEIFAYVSDIENLVDWSGSIIAIRKISPGELQVGATVRTTIRLLGRWMDVMFEIIEHEPGRYLTLKSLSGCPPCLFSYQFEPHDDGSTTVSLETVIDLTDNALELDESVVTNAIQRQIEHDLLTLKDLLEARSVRSPVSSK
jgi:uncharacterized membrane protein